MGRLKFPFWPGHTQKLSLLATLPLILAVTAIAIFVAMQSKALDEREIETLETRLLHAKKIKMGPDVTEAQVAHVLSTMIRGSEGSFQT